MGPSEHSPVDQGLLPGLYVRIYTQVNINLLWRHN